MKSDLILGSELVQVIQSTENDVPLVSGRAAILRIYIQCSSITKKTEVTLSVTNAINGEEVEFSSFVTPIMANNETLSTKRSNYHSSLNFKLPARLIESSRDKGKLEYSLELGDDIEEDEWNCEYQFVGVNSEMPISVRSIGIRYADPGFDLPPGWRHKNKSSSAGYSFYEPDIQSADEFKSLLKRCLPASRTDFSHLVVSAPAEFRPSFPRHGADEAKDDKQIRLLNCLHGFLKALRTTDGRADSCDSKHSNYYSGMLSGPTEDFRGAVSGLPIPSLNKQNTANVSIGLADADGSYSLHEMCHLIGGLHPGNPGGKRNLEVKLMQIDSKIADEPDLSKRNKLEKQREKLQERMNLAQEDEIMNKHVNGSLNDSKEGRGERSYMGIDMGDSTHAVAVKSPERYYDIMSYRHNLWISNYSYRIFQKKLGQPGIGYRKVNSGQLAYRVIGRYFEMDEKDKLCATDNMILHVLPVETTSGHCHDIVKSFDQFPNSKFVYDANLIDTVPTNISKAEISQGFIKLLVQSEESRSTYFVQKRVKPGAIVFENRALESYAKWGVFELDLIVDSGDRLLSIEIEGSDQPYLASKQQAKPITSEAEKIFEGIRLTRGLLETENGFNIQIFDIPVSWRYYIQAKNERDKTWQSIAAESVADNINRQADETNPPLELFIDKSMFVGSRAKVVLNFRVMLVSGFDCLEKVYSLSYRGF